MLLDCAIIENAVALTMGMHKFKMRYQGMNTNVYVQLMLIVTLSRN